MSGRGASTIRPYRTLAAVTATTGANQASSAAGMGWRVCGRGDRLVVGESRRQRSGRLTARTLPDVSSGSDHLWNTGVGQSIIVYMAESRARVVVAEDDVLLREGLASLLAGAGFDIVGRYGTHTELMAHVLQLNPDLVIVDIRMPPTHTTEGLDAARTIRQELPDTAILVLSGHVEVEQATELLRGGQRMGYLLKDRVSDVEDFLSTLDRIIRGASVVDPALVQELLAARQAKDPLQPLSPREREVLALMAEGLSNAGIAHRLWLAEGTIEKHVRSILTKLGIAEAAQSHRRVLAVLTFLDSN
jgi:DNA-binding NarL/FixJ family response regulator